MSAPKISKIQKRLNTPKEQREPLGKPIEPNFFWDELNKLYIQVVDSANNIGAVTAVKVDEIINNPDKKSLIKDESKLVNYINMINKDIEDYKVKLSEVYNEHKDKTGGTVDPDGHMLALSLYGKYSDITTVFESNLEEYTNDLSKELEAIETEYETRYSIKPVIDAEFKMTGDE